MELNHDNYFSQEAGATYCSSSQFKDIFGTRVKPGCEARGMARLRGEWEEPRGDALLVGSYVDSYFTGDLEAFKKSNPDIFTKKGELKAAFKQAEEIIAFAQADEGFMEYLQGEKQVILTGEIEGVKFKGAIDNLMEDAIVDLKVMASITKKHWMPEVREYVSFLIAWGYDIQLAIYQELAKQKYGKHYTTYIAALTKESATNKEIIWVDDDTLNEAMEFIKSNLQRYKELRAGAEPVRCGKCNYCRATKKITMPVHYLDIEEE